MSYCVLDQTFIILILVIVVIIILAIIIHRRQYETQEERDANRGKLWFGISVAVAGAIGVFVLYQYVMQSKSVSSVDGARPEYGFREAWSEMVEKRKAVSAAKKQAKKSGASPDQIRQAERQAKQEFRGVKQAGQEAAFKAREAARAQIATKKP